MSPDRMDGFIRRNFPAAEIAPERVERVIASVLAKIDGVPPPVRRTWRHGLGDLFAIPAWVGQYAVPMGVAASLGIVFGIHMMPERDAAELSSLLISSSLSYLGY